MVGTIRYGRWILLEAAIAYSAVSLCGCGGDGRNEVKKLAGREPLLKGLERGLGPAKHSPEGVLLDDHPFAHPYHWAGFILTGDPR